MIQRGIELRPRLGLLCQRPRLALHDVLVHRTDQVPRRLQRQRDLKNTKVRLDGIDGRFDALLERAIQIVARFPWRCRHDALAIALNHRGRPADHVAEIVGEVRVEARKDPFVREVGVLAERHLAHHEVAQRIDAEDRDIVLVASDVADRLRHLRAAHQPPAVRDDPSRRRQARRHQERRPVERVLPDDLFANQVRHDGPVALDPRT